MLAQVGGDAAPSDKGAFRLASIEPCRRLMPMAMDARRPMFFRTPSNGAAGACVEAVKDCCMDFLLLRERLLKGTGASMFRVLLRPPLVPGFEAVGKAHASTCSAVARPWSHPRHFIRGALDAVPPQCIGLTRV